jgi:hypothetical protein
MMDLKKGYYLIKTNHLHQRFLIVKIILSQTIPILTNKFGKYYSYEKQSNLLRSSFNDGSGLDIYQFIATDSVSKSGKKWKNGLLFKKKQQKL